MTRINPFADLAVEPVINASGKMTALGGSAQNDAIAQAQAAAAGSHVDLARLRQAAATLIARRCGAEAACITSGAAAGLAIAVAAVVTGIELEKIQRLPDVADSRRNVLLQAGHDIDFGAPIEQMIRLGGGRAEVVGTNDAVIRADILAAINANTVALVHVLSHHCLQNDRLNLTQMIDLAHKSNLPLIVDAAAEEDLLMPIAAGADLVTYSGGKAIGGPTCGFICGRRDLIEACEAQGRGIARAMKIGKEAIMGLVAALQIYPAPDNRAAVLDLLEAGLRQACRLAVSRITDRAGRAIERIAIHGSIEELKALIAHLEAGEPSIRTRNHQIRAGYVQLDPRELHLDQVPLIVDRFRTF